ncbi:MAG: hypothetical protein HY690_21185 [Chloroflexi bacterium]|nr:hypothetical protein [Chloroflexota bacterium]
MLLGVRNQEFLAAADLGYFRGYWSVWIAAEFARVRTEWIALRATRELASQTDVKARLERSRAKVNAQVATLARVLTLVDYLSAAGADLVWLSDDDDRPIVQTAIAAGVPGTLVTDNRRDFPLGEVRNGILILSSAPFLEALYRAYPEAPAAIAAYLGRARSN